MKPADHMENFVTINLSNLAFGSSSASIISIVYADYMFSYLCPSTLNSYQRLEGFLNLVLLIWEMKTILTPFLILVL